MFYQAELLDEELSIYRRAATQLYGNGEDASPGVTLPGLFDMLFRVSY